MLKFQNTLISLAPQNEKSPEKKMKSQISFFFCIFAKILIGDEKIRLVFDTEIFGDVCVCVAFDYCDCDCV